MNRVGCKARQAGFTLVELLTALAIFLIICGAAFTLLASSQQRYRTEAQVLTSFQEARLGLDQIVRDVNDAGFPPPTFSDGIAADAVQFAVTPFAWSPGYTASPAAPCQIGTAGGGTCNTPGDFDLLIETNPNPQLNPNVQWIRYQLQGTTLMRGMVDKAPGNDPFAYMNANGNPAPFVQNVVNNQVAPYLAVYPGTFPGGNPVPVFSYTCDTGNIPQPCPLLGATNNSPANIRDVVVTLIVAAPSVDATTGVPRIVQLTGRGRRINPNQ
jgi:prepilin-type N-terminal cleavage/methylation domain-containing protein